jgi:hypothetical protein
MQTLNAAPARSSQPRMQGLMQHVFLIASQTPPRIVEGGRSPLQTMQLIVVSADDASWSGEGAIGPLPALPSPQMLMRPSATSPALMPHEVTGEILRDARGQLYEKVGDQVRPVNRLCHDKRGQVIDLLPLRAPARETSAARPQPAAQRPIEQNRAAAPKQQPVRAPAPASPKTSIPEEFGKPWEMRHSRDEVVYDMNVAATRGALRRFIQRVFQGISSRDMTKWQALLSGKTVDQQLWSVKPPQGAFNDPRARRWVAQALQFGGYDVARMQVEWEIHWRRQAP